MPTKIEWTDETWTPIRARNKETGGVGHFCVHVSPGCEHCYAEGLQKRFSNPIRYAAQDAEKVELFLDEKVLMKPLAWRKPRQVFVCSMTDLFYEGVPNDWIDRIMGTMAECGNHTFQVLTKRSARMHDYFTRLHHGVAAPSNAWLGVSVEDRARIDRINQLRDTPAAIRFLSLEPLLEDLGQLDLTGIDWVIVGGESGPKARPMHPQWARNIRDQCVAAGVPYFFKQWGGWKHAYNWPHFMSTSVDSVLLKPDGSYVEPNPDLEWFDEDGVAKLIRIGKKRAGRTLDGRTWDEMPD